ncbi:general amino acid permease 1 [Pterulicium gracile]|uniref:General amino acid permease 1 n=1 Tax=Pterulicium gracile TaxID=1884261 RepID=A0A5C3QM81_9AGAR|nr:general amino acid permease 1 [Pterula gracilis]
MAHTDINRAEHGSYEEHEKASDDIVHDQQHESPKYAVVEDERYRFDAADLDRVQRRLKQRHVQMIAIAGTIGTGLFLGSGGALAAAGPAGTLIAYILVGSVAYSSLCAVGEMTTHAPISGTFPHFAARWVDPAFGFAVGWNYFYTNCITVPVEVTAATILLTFWDSNESHAPIYTAVIGALMCSINIFGVRWFGESEFGFSLIKISLIIGLILCGLVLDLGGGPDGDRIGFRYWRNPGPFARANLVPNIGTDRFLAMITVLVQAAFSFQGMELVAVAASETENPRRNIKKAVRRVFYRILIFYVLGILMIGMLVAYNDERLLRNDGNAHASPFVIAIDNAGVKGLPHVINAAVFTSAFSAGNSFLYCASRILYGLALRGQAPKIFTYCTKSGLPIAAVIASAVPALLSFMNVRENSAQVFDWFVNLTTVGGFFSWWAINITYLRFRKGMILQGFDLKKNVYNNTWQPYVAYWGIFWLTIFILINGFEVFFDFNGPDFLTSYLNIPLFLGFFLFWKITKKTKFWRAREMDFVTGIPTIEETESAEMKPTTLAGKIAAAIF